jgi:hypothetical protein
MRALALLVLAGVAACGGDFDDPTIVYDLRVLGMQAEPPEVVVDVDLQHPDLSQIDLPPVTFTVLVADPGEARRLSWTMTACARNRDGLCFGDPTDQEFASGTADDPEMPGGAQISGSLVPSFPLLMAALEADDLHGAAGIPIHVELRIEPEGGGEVAYAYKREFYTPRIPEERQANRNPAIHDLTVDEVSLPAGRCQDPATAPLVVAPGGEIELMPLATEDSEETFVLPTEDGGVREFTESIEWSWYVTAGSLSDGDTGGSNPIDRDPPDENHWTAPEGDALAELPDGRVTLWLVQRDRRGGMSWIERCLLVQ